MTIISIYNLLERINNEFKIIDDNYRILRFDIINKMRELNINYIKYENHTDISLNYMIDDKYLNTFLDIYQDFICNQKNIKEYHKDLLCNIIQKYKVNA